MKSRSLFAVLLLAGVTAWAGGIFSKKYLQTATLTAPTVGTASTNCIPLTHTLSRLPVTEVEVTVMDHNDGGVSDDEYLVGARVSAYRYDPSMVLLDGGGAITREVAYDFALRDLTLDGHAPSRAQTTRFTLPDKGIDNENGNAKLCFVSFNTTTDGGSAVDGGTALIVDLLVRGRY